jgi:hypothetical protein
VVPQKVVPIGERTTDLSIAREPSSDARRHGPWMQGRKSEANGMLRKRSLLKHLVKRLTTILLVSSCLGVVYGIGFYNGMRSGAREGYDSGYNRGTSNARKDAFGVLNGPAREIKKTRNINNLFLQAVAQPSELQ